MQLANLGLRFTLELRAVGGVASWGFQATDHPLGRMALGLAAAAVLIVVWGRVLARNARSGLTRAQKNGGGAVVLLIAAGALVAAGQPAAGVIYAALVVVSSVLLFVLGDDVSRSLADVGQRG